MQIAHSVTPVGVAIRAIKVQSKQTIDPDFSARHDAMLFLENRLRYQAQSILSYMMPWPEIPSASEAVDIINWAAQAAPVR